MSGPFLVAGLIAGYDRRPNSLQRPLFDFGFFVDYMLANGGIIFLDLHFLRHVALILISSVKMSGARTGYEANFFSSRFSHFRFL